MTPSRLNDHLSYFRPFRPTHRHRVTKEPLQWTGETCLGDLRVVTEEGLPLYLSLTELDALEAE